MDKKTLIIILSLIFIITIIGISLLKDSFITGKFIFQDSESPNYSTYTKAICNKENFCQDYIITCENGNIINQTPITGSFIQQNEDWQDPRNDSQKQITCQ